MPRPADPQAFNRYSYVRNNPLRYTDPDGHDPVDNACEYSGRCGDASPAPAPSATAGPSGPEEYGPGEGPQTPPADDPCTWRECHTFDEVPHAPQPTVEPGQCGYGEHCSADLLDRSVEPTASDPSSDSGPSLGQVAVEVAVNTLILGHALYECYRDPLCVTGIALALLSGPPPIPAKATSTLSHIDQTGQAPQGYKGGGKFENDGRNGGQKLPTHDSNGKPINYRSWDVDPQPPKGQNPECRPPCDR